MNSVTKSLRIQCWATGEAGRTWPWTLTGSISAACSAPATSHRAQPDTSGKMRRLPAAENGKGQGRSGLGRAYKRGDGSGVTAVTRSSPPIQNHCHRTRQQTRPTLDKPRTTRLSESVASHVGILLCLTIGDNSSYWLLSSHCVGSTVSSHPDNHPFHRRKWVSPQVKSWNWWHWMDS